MLNPSSFREAIRTVTVSYPVPFLIVVLLAFAIVCFSGSLLPPAEDGLRWVLATLGTVSALSGIALAVLTPILRPNLLRSERYSLINRWFDAMGNDEVTPSLRRYMGEALPILAEGTNTRKPGSTRTSTNPQG